MKKSGYTLTEVMIAMFISTLVIFGVVTAYLNGITLMRRSGRQLQAQQQAIVTMNKVCDYVRASNDLDVFVFVSPSTWTNSDQGNFLVTYSIEGDTTAFYYVNNNMYCVPAFSQLGFTTNTKYLLASNIKDETYFHEDVGNIYFNLEITDVDDTNMVLFSSITRFMARN